MLIVRPWQCGRIVRSFVDTKIKWLTVVYLTHPIEQDDTILLRLLLGQNLRPCNTSKKFESVSSPIEGALLIKTYAIPVLWYANHVYVLSSTFQIIVQTYCLEGCFQLFTSSNHYIILQHEDRDNNRLQPSNVRPLP